MRKIGTFFLLSFAAYFSTNAQISVTNSPPYNTVSYLVQNVLLGQGVTASNFTYNGIPVAVGFFNGLNTNLGLDSGIILTCGDINLAVGPNNNTSAALQSGLPGDPDLDLIMSPTLSFDASIIEFDFIPYSDTVKFRYVFGSDEYMEWVSTTPGGINDGFGFFLSGPGINGPYSNNAVNIALIPNTSLPVTMFNLNLNNNGQYYFDNGDGNGTGTAPDGQHVQYDGFTIPLTAIHAVQCGQQYHIKIAIGDGGDDWIDSGVFLEAGSFSSSGITLGTHFSYGGPNDSTLFEGCGSACLVLVRSGNLANQDTVFLTIGGQATNGVDYTPAIPPQVIFAPGVDSVTICLSAVVDGNPEGLELVTITSSSTGFCSQTTSSGASFYIGDYIPLTLNATNDTTICPNTQLFLNAQASGGVQPYTYSWSNGSNNQTIVVTPTSTTTYTVTVTDSCGSPLQTQTITVNVAPSGPQIGSPDYTICQGEQVTINLSVVGGAPSFTCNWITLSGPDTIPNTVCNSIYTFTPTGNGAFIVSITDGCNRTDIDTIYITVENNCNIIIPNVFTPNGDGQNDYFSFQNLEHFPNSRLVVYNRWGSKIFDDPDYKNNWNGDKHVDGTYYFILYLPDGKTIPGYLTLLRNK